MYCLFCVVLCIVYVYMCTELLPPGGYPIAVKYIISYRIKRGMEKKKSVCNALIGKPDAKRSLERCGPKWEDNIKKGLWNSDLEIWTGLEWLRKKASKTCVRMVPRDAQTAKNVLPCCLSLSFLLEVSVPWS
jgi:hypothetical protein